MPTDASSRRRDRTAILGSIAFHLCVLATLLAVRPASFPADEPDERALLAGFIRIERAPPTQRPAPRAPPSPAPARTQPVERPPIRAAVAHVQAGHGQVVAAEPRYVAPLADKPAPRHARAAPAHAPVVVAAATETPAPRPPSMTPTPAPSPAPSSLLAARDIGPGNFGESYPARPMPGMLDALRTRLNGHVVVQVAVDERGHATSVTIVSGIDDPALRDEVTRTLLAASYIPASCNGLGCAATVELRT
jgi:outer membrane biosynthesis protein TonB